MTSKERALTERLKKLEERVEELEARPHEVHHHYPAPQPVYVYPYQPYTPPYWGTLTCGSGTISISYSTGDVVGGSTTTVAEANRWSAGTTYTLRAQS